MRARPSIAVHGSIDVQEKNRSASPGQDVLDIVVVPKAVALVHADDVVVHGERNGDLELGAGGRKVQPRGVDQQRGHAHHLLIALAPAKRREWCPDASPRSPTNSGLDK
jgi:hypothetical protein